MKHATRSLKAASLFAALSMMLISNSSFIVNAAAKEGSRADASPLVAEVRSAFKLHGKPVPPEIFRDMGDGDMADSTSIWVTADLEAAIGSNLYADDTREERGWFIQTKAAQGTSGAEVTAYKFVGSTENGLVVVIASYNGGGSGTFHTLHILDVATARAFDLEGQPYQRVNLTSIRSVALGDRWDGDVSISKDVIRVVTTRDGPTGGRARPIMTIQATKP